MRCRSAAIAQRSRRPIRSKQHNMRVRSRIQLRLFGHRLRVSTDRADGLFSVALTSRYPGMIEISGELTGTSPAIRALQADIELAAACDAKVLITGDTGTGKEVTARLIHAGSQRRARPFVAINCGGIPETLLESELFGHARGSFTGACRDRIGLLAAANLGTVFLDEVGEMSLRMQALLLRFLETGEIQRVGRDGGESCVDVRIIAATNRDLLQQVGIKAFRFDLFYRLNVLHLRTPALRDHPEDIRALFDHFLHRYSHEYRLPMPRLTSD